MNKVHIVFGIYSESPNPNSLINLLAINTGNFKQFDFAPRCKTAKGQSLLQNGILNSNNFDMSQLKLMNR